MTALETVAELVEAAAGLRFEGHQRRRFVRAVDGAARAARCDDLESYAAVVRSDDDALHGLVDALTVGETYFFRDEAQGRLLQSLLTEAAEERPSRAVEVWSAGCASGEEAYSIAMLAGEVDLLARVRIVGTDVSRRALAVAEGATFGRRSLRAVSDARRRRWFEHGGGTHRVVPDVRTRVRFRRANLLDGAEGVFDIVVCRNVLIYLSPAAVHRAAALLRDALRPGGWLVTGASDPNLDAAGLVRQQTALGLAYRRDDGAAARAPARKPARRFTAGAADPPPTSPTPAVPLAPRRPSPDVIARPTAVTAEDVRRLADAGRRAEAVDALAVALRDRPVDADLRYLDALLHLDAGRFDAAADAARAALYLDPGLALAHLALANAERARGNRAAAVRSYGVAAQALSALPPDAVVAGASEPQAGHLAAMAARLAQEASAGG